MKARVAHFLERELGDFGVFHRHRFGNFAGKSFRLNAIALQGRFDAVDQIILAHLVARNIDGNPHAQALLTPALGFAAGLFNDPGANGANQPILLGQGNKNHGADQAALRMVPAQQGLCAGHLQAVGLDLGLEIQFKFTFVQGAAQVVEQHRLLTDFDPHFGVIQTKVTTAIELDTAHGQRRVAQQLSYRTVLWVDGDAHRTTELGANGVKGQRNRQCV